MVDKITTPITPLEEVDKINEIIDAIGSSGVSNPLVLSKEDSGTTYSYTVGINSNNRFYAEFTNDNGGGSTVSIPGFTQVVGTSGITATASTQTNDTYQTIQRYSLGVSYDTDTLEINQNGELAVKGISSRNIGEIVASTVPLTDAGLHLLDGTQLSGSGIYADFVDYIGDLYNSGDYTAIFDTEANWQAAVTANGVCGKFVYTAAAGGSPATVRLPLITGFTEGTVTVSELGDLTEAGLPNITGSIDPYVDINRNATGAFSANNTAATNPVGTNGNGNGSHLMFNAADSNSIYGNSNTVQPQAIKVLYYIVVATSTKTDIQVDIDEIATDLNMKVDKSTLSEVYPVIETYNNGNSWYIVYSNGFCIQGSTYYKGSTVAGDNTIIFLKTFADINFTFTAQILHSSTNLTCYAMIEKYPDRTVSGTKIYTVSAPFGYAWVAYGYVSMGS